MRKLISDRFGLEIKVVVRTRDELAEVVSRNPLRKVAKEPKRYQVSFVAAEPESGVVRKPSAAAVGRERLAHAGREIWAWHLDGVGRSKLAALLGRSDLGVTATSRNWTTVTKLLAMADEA